MAKTSKDKAKKGVPNKHLHARIAYLHQAANYLSVQSLARSDQTSPQATANDAHKSNPTGEQPKPNPPGTLATDATTSLANSKPSPGQTSTATFNPPPSGLPLLLTAHLRSVAQKGTIRLSRDLKHSFCKVCSSLLIEGQTCITSTENLSRKGRKPWAKVAVVTCCACGACKRFPVGAKRQKRKALRRVNEKEESEVQESGVALGAVRDELKDEGGCMEGVVEEPIVVTTNGSCVLPDRNGRTLVDTGAVPE